MPGIDSRVPDADVPEQRRLLEILVVLCAVFGGVSVLVHMVVTDPGAALMGLVLLAAGLAFLAIRSLLDRLSLRTTVVATVATTLVAGLACAWAQPIYTVFTVVPLLAVGIALPYVRGTALRSIMVVAWLATMLTTYILETSTYMSSLAPEIRSFFLFGGLSGAVGAFLLQLWRFSSRLRGALDQAQAAEVLREESETRYGALVGRLAGVVYVSSFGSDSPIHYVSPQVESLFGYTQAEWVAGNGMWASRIHEDDRIRVLGEESGTLATADTHTWEYRLLTRDGRELWIRDDETVVSRAADGTPLMVQGFMLDITNQKRLEAELSHQAFHDALTGLPNRAAFAERVNGAISRSRRSGQALAVAYIDLDDFKVVNDTLGHAVGDRLLIDVADRLHASLRGGDAAARVGGDEFNVLLEGLADTIDAEDVVRRILDLLSQPYRLDDREVRIRATAGIAGLDDSVATAEDLQRHADAALYEAKADGKSRLAWFDPAMSARAWARLDLEHGLRRALEQGELEVAYQPVVDLATGALDGIEALARWRHPERGMVPPDEFIPVAERAGLIADLGRSVLGEACRASVRMGTALDREPLPMSVNVSSRQILDSDLVGDVRTALAQAGLPARCLTLELTESVMVLEGGRTDQIIAALRALGVRLAIDDFGTGYSSLSLARRFPIDELKIDRSFVSGLGRTDEDAAIVAAAIAFARALHLDVTAEGVETTDQAASLRALGCDRAQGYLFARPMTEAALLAILAGGGMAAPRTPPALLQAG